MNAARSSRCKPCTCVSKKICRQASRWAKSCHRRWYALTVSTVFKSPSARVRQGRSPAMSKPCSPRPHCPKMSPSSSTWTRRVFRRAFYKLRGRKKNGGGFQPPCQNQKRKTWRLQTAAIIPSPWLWDILICSNSSPLQNLCKSVPSVVKIMNEISRLRIYPALCNNQPINKTCGVEISGKASAAFHDLVVSRRLSNSV